MGNYWPALLRLRSRILGLDFSRKAQVQSPFRGPAAPKLFFAITAPKFCTSASSLFRCRGWTTVQSAILARGRHRCRRDLITIASGGQERGRRSGLSRVAQVCLSPGFVPRRSCAAAYGSASGDAICCGGGRGRGVEQRTNIDRFLGDLP